ncbi:hypothetical protein IPG41_05000 [Candidatus Peregrinibacteria bacterium]|nr:MAG: hypothetical protein IPG41_05000 [Candidatus Peregrinibacteria bacterium]
MGRVANRAAAIPLLEALLAETDKTAVLNGLRAIRIGGNPLGFEAGFEAKDLPAIKEAIGEVIAQMRELNGEVAGLSTAINKGLVGTAKTGLEQEGTYETQLEGPQVEWVRKGIEARYDRTRLVNAPLLEEEGVPAFPDKEAALKSALKQLTREQVAYMMEEGRSPFMFQMKLVGPSKKGIDLQRTLVNGQPKRMGTPKQGQQEMYVWEGAERHLASKPAGKTEWKWEFVQGEQIIEPQKEDDVSLLVEDRVKQVRRARPKGMRGTDRYTLATLMADGLEAGKPLDIRFKGDAMNTEEYEVWNATLMDEEGELTEGQYRCLVGGGFVPNDRYAYLYRFSVLNRNGGARFRSSVDGSIEA